MHITEPITRLTIATLNQGKLVEIKRLLAGMPIEILSLLSLTNPAEVEETGATFAENAELKASQYAQMTGTYTLADDSGLEVAALGGRPGVHSARYGGAETGFDEKMAMILAELDDSGREDRSARFVCSMAVADPSGRIVYRSDGICSGRIAPQPCGNGGFGYDPIFVPDGFDRTFGELSAAIKHEISHRASALAEIMPFLRDNTAL